jgi:hypothetical protein
MPSCYASRMRAWLLLLLSATAAVVYACSGETSSDCVQEAPEAFADVRKCDGALTGGIACGNVVVADEVNAYSLSQWTSPDAGVPENAVIEQTPIPGGKTIQLYTTEGKPEDAAQPYAMNVSGAYVYVVVDGGFGPALGRIAVGGGPMEMLTKPDFWEFRGPNPILIDAANAYWAEDSGGSLATRIVKAPLRGGPLTTLFENGYGTILSLALESGFIYFDLGHYSETTGMLDGIDDLQRVSVQGGTVETLVGHSNEGPWEGMGAANDTVIVLSGIALPPGVGGPGLFDFARIPTSGGQLTPFGLRLRVSLGALDVDPAGIYAGVLDDAGLGTSVIQVPVAGGLVRTISNTEDVSAVATNGTYLFWIDEMKGKILRVCK